MSEGNEWYGDVGVRRENVEVDSSKGVKVHTSAIA